MNPWRHVAIGAVLAGAGWLLARAAAGARFTAARAVLIDGAVPLAGFVLMSIATARPIATGFAWFALMAAYGIADRTKRATLREPVVYTDLFQTIDVLIRHPELNAVFKRNHFAASGVLGVAVIVAVFFAEPAAWSWSPWGRAVAVAVVGSAVLALHWLLARRYTILHRLRPCGDPVDDAAVLGPFAMHIAHCVIARAERAARQRAAAPPVSHGTAARPIRVPCPLIVVQSESFFDPRRLHPAISRDLLPTFDACCRNGVQWGHLAVPGVGANTVRTEFAVLTGLSEAALGFDRFNPYRFFARVPIQSLAWRMRAEGYRTFCVHPFDRRFYRRDLVMKNLGFDVFLGAEAFAGAVRAGPYVSDVEVARVVAELVREEGSGVFVFAITMENHGPWRAPCRDEAPDLARGLREFPAKNALNGFLRGIQGADAMLRTLTELLRGDPGVLAFYGDHLPNLPAAFARLEFRDTRSDYVIWRPGGSGGSRRDLTACRLSRAIWDSWQSTAGNLRERRFPYTTIGSSPVAVPAPADDG